MRAKIVTQTKGHTEDVPANQILENDKIDRDNGEDSDFIMLREHQDIIYTNI